MLTEVIAQLKEGIKKVCVLLVHRGRGPSCGTLRTRPLAEPRAIWRRPPAAASGRVACLGAPCLRLLRFLVFVWRLARLAAQVVDRVGGFLLCPSGQPARP